MKELIKGLVESYAKNRLSLPVGFFLVLIVVISIIVIPNFNQISEKLGFDTRTTLEKKLTDKDNTIDRLGEGNKQLSLTIDKLNESNKVDLETVVKDSENKEKVDIVLSEIKVKAKKKFSNITTSKSSFKAKLKVKSVELQLAEIQIQAVWETYCKFNNDSECDKNI